MIEIDDLICFFDSYEEAYYCKPKDACVYEHDASDYVSDDLIPIPHIREEDIIHSFLDNYTTAGVCNASNIARKLRESFDKDGGLSRK